MAIVSDVHVPTAMGNLSVIGRKGLKHEVTRQDIDNYAKSKGISFAQAYREFVSSLIQMSKEAL